MGHLMFKGNVPARHCLLTADYHCSGHDLESKCRLRCITMEVGSQTCPAGEVPCPVTSRSMSCPLVRNRWARYVDQSLYQPNCGEKVQQARHLWNCGHDDELQ
jgi:hypothetical protein